jgi:type II secretion system protein I
MTLMEVILAIAILGGSLAVLGELIRVGARASSKAQKLATAQLLADSLTAQVCASCETPTPTEGAEEFGGYTWAYTLDVQQVEQQGLLAIMVTVRENIDPTLQPITYSLVRWMIDPQVEYDLEMAAAQAEAAAAEASGTTSDAAASGGEASGGSR